MSRIEGRARSFPGYKIRSRAEVLEDLQKKKDAQLVKEDVEWANVWKDIIEYKKKIAEKQQAPFRFYNVTVYTRAFEVRERCEQAVLSCETHTDNTEINGQAVVIDTQGRLHYVVRTIDKKNPDRSKDEWGEVTDREEMRRRTSSLCRRFIESELFVPDGKVTWMGKRTQPTDDILNAIK